MHVNLQWFEFFSDAAAGARDSAPPGRVCDSFSQLAKKHVTCMSSCCAHKLPAYLDKVLMDNHKHSFFVTFGPPLAHYEHSY